ncbi:MAG: class I SAM-dependent methyltransferase [Gemmatimonadota bacterium]
MTDADARIAQNVLAHDAVARTYDAQHPEIFNEIEQARLAAAVREALGAVHPASLPGARVLDVGTGTGNLTAHFLTAGAQVTAADVSPECLRVVREKFDHTGRLESQLLDGRSLAPLPDGAFDVAACYSVLHHVPDYPALVREMARVVRRGGVVYIDHERHDASWKPSAERDAFMAEAIVWPPKRWTRFITPANFWKRIKPLLSWRRWRDPRWMPEGDLHIWPDDHIEWTRVEAALAAAGVKPVAVRDYLLFEARYRRDAWERWRERITDYRTWIGSKA